MLGDLGNTPLRGLQKYWHQRIVFLDDPDQVKPRVKFLGLAAVSLTDHHPDIGDDSHQVLLVSFEIRQGILIACREEDFRSGALAVFLLVIIKELGQELAALCDQKFV